MVRLATYTDIPSLAQRWYEEKAKTCFAQLDIEWTVEGCAGYLMEALQDYRQVIFVTGNQGQIIAACGVILQQDLLPPHPLVVGEWMWWGSTKRTSVQVLQAMKQWGKEHGALLARYTLNQPSQSPTKFSETYRWEVL